MPTEGEGRSTDESQDLVRFVERLADDLAGLRAEFEAKIRYDEVKERQIAIMHEELQGFRAGLHLRLLQPVFSDLITMHDDLVESTRINVSEDGAEPTDPASSTASMLESVLDTLSRNGVTSFSVQSNEVDPARQRVISAVATRDESLDRRVQRRVRVGFEYDNGKVIRPEWIVAYRYARETEHVTVTPTAGGE